MRQFRRTSRVTIVILCKRVPLSHDRAVSCSHTVASRYPRASPLLFALRYVIFLVMIFLEHNEIVIYIIRAHCRRVDGCPAGRYYLHTMRRRCPRAIRTMRALFQTLQLQIARATPAFAVDRAIPSCTRGARDPTKHRFRFLVRPVVQY